jgi:hypothetical protein
MEPMKPMKPMERMEPIAASRWWPEELGAPDSSGSQDGWRYAYFPQRHVLAVERGGHVTQYDTGDHEIAGVSQTQGQTDAGPVFRSQKGELHVDMLTPLSPLVPRWRSPSPVTLAVAPPFLSPRLHVRSTRRRRSGIASAGRQEFGPTGPGACRQASSLRLGRRRLGHRLAHRDRHWVAGGE